MNISKIEWTDRTWNPVTGCTKGCKYCYARRMAYRLRGRHGYDQHNPFKPTFHEDKLNEPFSLRKPSKIFTVSMGELFAEDIPCGWIHRVMDVIRKNPRHTFQLLTKRPENLDLGEPFPDNVWMGLTVDGLDNADITDLKIMQLGRCGAKTKFISFEPLLRSVNPTLRDIDWIIIGKQTGQGAPEVDYGWVQYLINRARLDKVPVFLKDNLDWSPVVQEWPFVHNPQEVLV